MFSAKKNSSIIDAILMASVDRVRALLGGANQEALLNSCLPTTEESPLQLAYRLLHTAAFDAKKDKVAYTAIIELLKSAYQALRLEAISLADATLIDRREAVAQFITKNPLSDKTQQSYRAAVLAAVENGNLALTTLFLDAGVKVETRQEDDTLLMIAAQKGHEKLVDLLLERNANPSAKLINPSNQNSKGVTVLMLAATQKNVSIVQKLVEAGADITPKDNFNRTALDYATMRNYKKVTAYLTELFIKSGENEHTSLHQAIEVGALDRVKALIAQGADVNMPDTNGGIPLALALSKHNAAIAKLLCEAGADMTFRDSSGRDIWSLALNVPELIGYLVSRGMDINQTNADGMTPLLVEVSGFSSDTKTLQALIDAGADPRATYTRPVSFQDITFHAIASFQKSASKKGEESIVDLQQGFDDMNKAIKAAEFYKDKTPDFFATLSNRTPQNELYFDLYLKAKQKLSAKKPECHSALELAKLRQNRTAYNFLKKHLEIAADAYDAAAEELKQLAKHADAAFNAEAERIGTILGGKPQAWTKRKGVMHYTAALHKSLPGHYAATPTERKNDVDRVDGFEGTLLALLQAEVRSKGYTLIWCERNWDNKPLTRLLLFPTANDLVALAACGTNGVNSGHDTRDVVNWCATRRQKHPLYVLGASYDSMELEFVRPIPHAGELAKHIASFCSEFEVPPDDARAVAQLAKELEEEARTFFWWD